MKKINRILTLFACFFTILFLIIFTIKLFLLKTIKGSEKWDIENIKVSPCGINLKNLSYNEKFFTIKIDQLKIKPSIIKNLYAFEGPGEFNSEYEKKKISASGKLKGNLINGNLSINETKIEISNTGNLKFYGTLEKWGIEKFEGIVELNGLKIKELIGITKYNFNLDGLIYGKIYIGKEKENFKEIKFNLEVKDLTKNNENKFNLSIKGNYLPQEKRGIIESGILTNQKGEKLIFNGSVTENEFEFTFDTKEFSLDEFLKLLPEEIRKKYNLKLDTSRIIMNKFALAILKKKLILMENYNLKQNFSDLGILNLKT
ncbi:MAG: hypothetical protein NC926_01235 [Candidatus Omnitrophica bacterium]|nr:hypothetical protein [Candidatus Omnitrophota bacterium]MCM8806573.1 hypothetical protein [Candidatus Omnitrophota bacterium]